MSTAGYEFFFSKEHEGLGERVREIAKKEILPILEKHEGEEENAAREIVSCMGKAGFLRFLVSDAYGGVGEKLDLRSLCLIRESLAYYNGMAEFLFAMQGLGSYPITLAGDKDLKRKFLPAILSGEAVGAFAVTEPEAGSDVASMKTSAVRSRTEWILDGTKTFISNAGIADFYIVFAKTDAAAGHKGISAFVVEKDMKGLEFKKKQVTMSPHPLGEIAFEGCRVPASNLLGATGEGFKIAMKTLDLLRTTVGAAALGLARRAIDEALDHVKSRKQFGQPLSSFQLVQQDIADMETQWDASRLLVYRSAWTKDNGAERVTKESAMAKSYATEAAGRIIDRALQLHGGTGVLKGTTVERLYREIRALRIYEGTTEILKMVIARSVLEG